MNEKNLVNSAKNGDKSAFAQLYELYKDRLYRYAFYRLGSHQDAQDAVCDTVLLAYEEIGNLRKASAFSSWIFKIQSAVCSKYIDSQVKQRQNADIDDFKNSAKVSNCINTHTAELQEGLNILNEQERNIVLLSVVAGFNSNEISKITGLTPGSVRSNLSRSLTKMRNFLG